MADSNKAEAESRAPRAFSARAERSLKEADRVMKQNPDGAAHDRAMAQVEQAKVFALLELAGSIRASREG